MIATDQLIKELCRETGEPGLHNYTTIQGLMLDAIRDLNIYSMPVWSHKTLLLSTAYTYAWPQDCIKPLLSALSRSGSYYLLAASDDIMGTLTANPPASATMPVTDLFQIDGYVEAYGWSVYSWGIGEAYGLETMRPPMGFVMDDYKNRRSFVRGLQVQTGDQIEFFYKSNGLEVCPQFVPDEAKEVMENFILHKYFRIRNPGLSARFFELYDRYNNRLGRLYTQGTEDSWIRAMNSNTNSAPKI